MSLLIDAGYGLKFNGISDSVLVPTNNTNLHGAQTKERKRLPTSMSSFTLETWFIPDSGGTIFEQDNVMRLTVGSPSSSAPAFFEVRLRNKNNGKDNVFTLSSAKAVNKANGLLAYWDGILFPTNNSTINSANLGSDVDTNDVTAFAEGSRELLNVTVTFDRRILSMHVNGDLLVEQVLEEEHELVPQQSQMFLGGRGGDFRGTLETIHLSASALPSGRQQFAPIKGDNTLGLWRFEEPINPIATRIVTPSLSASTATTSTITVSTTVAKGLLEELTGEKREVFTNFQLAPWSAGKYSYKVYTATSSNDRELAKVPFNLLINPLGYNTDTGKPTNKAPERVRLHSIDPTNGQIVVSSIHLDFSANPTTGQRGLLMAHDAGEFVVIVGDCIVDGGNGNVFQPQGSGTQFSQRQGQVIVDESDFENHGIMFSMSMAVDSHEYNQFSASTTNMGTDFLIGHTGRHILNHVKSHPFMGLLPPPESHNVEKKLDAGSDVVNATFMPQFGSIKDIVPVNSVISSFDTHGKIPVNDLVYSSVVSTFIENGMSDIDDTKRGLLAIGGPQFNTEPFLLKSISSTDAKNDIKALIPSSENRIATLVVPDLETYNYAPFVQIHYNAIDRTGEHFDVGATSRLTANISTATLTLQSVKSFGVDGVVIPASRISIDGETPFTSYTNQTATITYSAKTIVFSATPNNSAFNTAAVNNAIVKLSDNFPKLLINKTLPDVSTIVTGTTSILDLIRTSANTKPLTLVSPGGVMTFKTPNLFPFDDGQLEGDDSEGLVGEGQLDLSLCPTNYLPSVATDAPQTTPKGVGLAQSELSNRSSVFHKVLVRNHFVKSSDYDELANVKLRKTTNGTRQRLGLTFSADYASSTSAAMNVTGGTVNDTIAVDDVIYKANGKQLGTVTAVTSSSITIGAGTSDAVVNKDELFLEPQAAGRGSTNQSTVVHEYFDIIEHKSRNNVTSLVIQPTDRSRFAQLSKMIKDTEMRNHISIEHLMSRARVLSFGDDSDGNTVLRAHGLISDIASSTVSVKGSASPDSHIVKEIMPGAPVVTMTLGGGGQGAVNTKETWDPAPLSRLAWNTRRDCQAKVNATISIGTKRQISVLPLNNNADDLQSWGTYCFPATGRVYLELSGNQGEQKQFASAEYTSKTGTLFSFSNSTGLVGSGTFVLADGSEADSFNAWVTATGIDETSVLHVDDKFSEESMCNDGTTINDRLFQSLDTVQHDYQLGSQYASTRALVEIPLFEEFFFDNPDKGIFPGPDNSMKLHIDATHTAHSWNPNPVGRRADAISPQDPEIFGPFSYTIQRGTHRSGTKVTRPYDSSNYRVYVEDANIFPIPTAPPTEVANLGGQARYRRAFLPNGEWFTYSARNTSDHYLTVVDSGDDHAFSENFLRDIRVGAHITPAPGYQDMNYNSIADNPSLISAGYERRRSFYYDRSNVTTQGGNADYGMKQYVSAIELRAGPSTNPHLPKIISKRPRAKAVLVVGSPATSIKLDDASLFPIKSPDSDYNFRVAWVDSSGNVKRGFYNNRSGNTLTITSPDTGFTPSAGDEIYVEDLYATSASTWPKVKETFLNRAWAHPYCPGGIRQGDTIWMNMHYTNPHAVEGLFCKSRGTLNEAEVWKGFNGGVGEVDANPRDSIPLENFLIGNSCIETAQNLVQHINKTIELNYLEVVGTSITAPVVAYLDPYQCTDNFVRILLYDVGHDREFIAFQDLHMQVQSSPAAARISEEDANKTGVVKNTVTDSGTQLDVAAGFPSQNKRMNTTTKSDFIEASYAHASDWNESYSGAISEHNVGGLTNIDKDSYSSRTNPAVASANEALIQHQVIDDTSRESSTFFDTPDGTRVIPAFLAMKGIRNSVLDLTSHTEARLQYLDQWTDMDFVRRLTLDLGEVRLKDGVTNIESAAREVVRLINQAGAKNGKTHARRPNDQFLGDSSKFDLSSPGPKSNAYSTNIDPAATHLHADFAATASTHDPAPFWDPSKAFSSHDRGTHMGYVRAHLGRVVLDSEDNPGFSIVIHSTIPGAAGRNFCTWLDSSKAQSPYRPQFLIGHGGRFRNYWCQPDEMTGENMHPAPMPINRFGRPFAPITTLKEHLPPENPSDPFLNNLNFGPDRTDSAGALVSANTEVVSGRNSNTLLNESFETKSPASTLVDGLRIGTRAKARINFGGLTQAGVPGWAPDVSKWGFDNDGTQNHFLSKYGNPSNVSDAMTVTTDGSNDGYIPKVDMKKENIGNNPLYGFRFVDHRGDNHTIRMVYRQFGQSFANDNTYLPATLDEEVIIHFDDRDVGQGGFTIGRHMVGTGEVCGEKTDGAPKKLKGNLWNNYPAPIVGVKVATTYSSGTMTVVLDAPYDTSAPAVMQTHPDILGYLGFPESGMFQLSKHGTDTTNDHQGLNFYYTSRTHNDYSGTHKFFGVIGGSSSHTNDDWFMSPRLNFTSLLTDEVIAAAVEYAINMPDSGLEGLDVTSFDCTNMFAPDGQTLGEWGVSPTAIRIHTRADRKVALSKLFEATRSKDWGLLEGASTDAVVSSKHTGGLSTGEIDAGTRLDIGYIPSTVLHITTKYRGSNANTATPILVDSQNNMVDITTWQRNLRGENFTDVAGDHIIPRVDAPCLEIHNVTSTEVHAASNESWALFGKLACDDTDSWGQPFLIWYSTTDWAEVRSKPDTSSVTHVNIIAKSANFSPTNHDVIFKSYSSNGYGKEIDGVRRAGSKKASPFLYFRGGRDSPDHWVPLYFGGGFSGAVVDINDGTQNDYSEFYTHPYSSGPTGSAGMQNIGEVAGSYALLDTNAMLAMFPGTPYLDQHRGQNNPPFFNQDALLTFDMTKTANNKVTGIDYTDGINTVNANIPSPIVLRFAHPHARYSPSGDVTDHTTYMVFGPGQAFPHNTAAHEPQGSRIVTLGNGYSAVPIHFNSDATKDTFLPNQLANGDSTEHSGFNRGSAEAHLPMTTFFQKNNETGFNYVMNWQPTKGFPSEDASTTKNYNQVNTKAFYYDGSVATTANLPKHYHPFNHVFSDISSNAVGSSSHLTTRKSAVVWHMDGGYHPGGHFLDNCVSKNPNHPLGVRLDTGSGAAHNVSAFRPCGLLAQAYLAFYGETPTNQVVNENIVIVDATRVQNAEELATIISASINTFPGKDPLKAMGGTFMPSMQNAHKQDRYGWVKASIVSYTAESGGTPASLVIDGSYDKLPNYGWVRVSDGTDAHYAPYISTSYSSPNLTLTLAKSPDGGSTNLINPDDSNAFTYDSEVTYEAYVWTKAGTHRHNNDSANTSRDHMCQVHFSGFVDAVDRTRPVGAVGWHGERYSYFNSLDLGSNTYAAGLGAWHPFLGFNPYGAAETCLTGSAPVTVTGETAANTFTSDYCVTGLASRHLIVISHESELPLIAKADRNGTTCTGDLLIANQTDSSNGVGTIAWDTGKVHNKDRYVGPATAGPHVEVQIHSSQFVPVVAGDYPAGNALPADNKWHRAFQSGDMVRANACRYPTGDLFWDESLLPSNTLSEYAGTYATECVGITGQDHYLDSAANQGHTGLFGYYNKRSAARNFLPEHVVWKRMDGGSLTMPAVNARGLGMIPWVKRKDSGATDYKLVGEKILGNVRFSFETTNAAMFPIIQAQELGHPQLAEQHPLEVRNALLIPNEHLQFDSVQVVDDTGQEHRIEGGSPFGTVIMDFRHISDREIEGLAPALAGAGVNPNLKIRLPNPDEVPGNIVIRSGFDRIQAYQNETIGSGGLHHPAQNITQIRQMFDHEYAGPRVWPTWENNGWEHLSQDSDDISLAQANSRLKFPASNKEGWHDHTDNNPLKSSFEPHDRSLYFHVTRMGATMTHRYDLDELSFTAYDETNNEIDVDSTPEDTTWVDTSEQSGSRYFLRVYDPTTDKGVIASYTGKGTNKFTGVVVSPEFKSFVTGKTGLKVTPSYYVPAGTTRMFAARRLRDHSEYSGASPDMQKINWYKMYSTLPTNDSELLGSAAMTPHFAIRAPKMTPMPIPRMGHHYVTPSMALMPGHYAHPAYQRIYDLHTACKSSSYSPFDSDLIGTIEASRLGLDSEDVTTKGFTRDPLLWFSAASAAYGPSDIHGGAFTLLTETKLKYEGYGIAASVGTDAGDINAAGGHTLVLEAAATYTMNNHFPDPLEVGSYQIIIQPNVFKQQLQGFHQNHSDAIKAPSEAGAKVTELTGQQVNTVIAIEKNVDTRGAYALILAEAMMADVRGCEVILNEVILDIDPDPGSQFASLPPLALYNPLGVQESTSPSFTRRSLPYRPGMFVSSTPGRTLTIPWWSILHKDGATASGASKFKHLEWYKPDNYYELCRAGYGAVGAQITLAGYPTSFLDIYEPHKRVRSLNPHCVVLYAEVRSGEILVDNADLFPVYPYYGEVLEYTRDGKRYTASYTDVRGTLATGSLGATAAFDGVTEITTGFWANINTSEEIILKLSRPYDNDISDALYLDSETSLLTRNLPQLANGSRDTNSLHPADAFLCMWHPNLGRPFTWYSDDSSRAIYTKAGTADTPVDQKPYNHVPEHFETIHYHDFNYVASKGPFALGMKWIKPPVIETDSYSLQAVSNSVGITANRVGINFQQIANTTTWMTGIRVVGDDIITSNRGNNNDYDTDNILFSKIDIANTNGTYDQQSSGIGDSDINSCDGFDIDPTGTKMIIANFHGAGVRSATLRTPFDLTTISLNGSQKSSGGSRVRAVAWNNDGSKYYMAYGSALRQFTTTTAYVVASGDSEGSSASISANTISDVLFNSDGTKMWLSGAGGYVREYTLSTPYDTSTFSLDVTLDLRTYFLNKSASVSQSGSDATPWISGIDWSDDGTKLYVSTLYGVIDDSKMSNNPSPSTVNGVDGASTTNRFPIMEISISTSTLREGTGEAFTASEIDADSALTHQGGTVGSNKYNFFGFWPGGSHGAGAVSRLESYGHSLMGWGSDTFGMDCETYQDSTGVATLSLPNDRNRCFGYRMAVRQLYNRPRWSPYIRGWLEVANSNAMLGYYNGPLIQQDSKTNGWDYVGSISGQTDVDFNALYVGILERITQVSSLLGQDQLGRQVRYSDGRRMTGPFGCPVRTARNASTVTRFFPNDEEGQGIEELSQAHRHYMVDWWGNTRGEDVRRFPVRGFGLRPSWDPEDAYKDTNVTHRPAANRLFGGDGDDRQSGNANTVNNDGTNMGTVDWFNPASMLRVGDRGDGRGCRWPTVFNESLLMAVSENHDATGLVLSSNTAEPVYGQGLVRPSNETLQAGEIERGISDRVDLDSDDGLLKPSAHVGEAIETVNADTRGAEPVSRDDVRLGLDVDTIAELNDGVSREYIVMSTEAHSLHTDREVGQRTNIRGAYNFGSRTLKDLDMTALDWSAAPVTGVVKHSDAHAMWPLGGTYVMDWNKHAGNLDVKGWGQQIPQNGLALWLRADSIDVDNGDAISEWKDRSGNGRDFSQSVANDKPTFLASDSTFNNKPCVQFSSNDALLRTFDAGLNTNEFTTILVMSTNNDNNNYQLGYESRSYLTSPTRLRGYNVYANMSGSNNRWEYWTGRSASSWNTELTAATGSAVVDTPNIVNLSIEGGNGVGGVVTAKKLRIDGVDVASSTPNYHKNQSEPTQLGRLNDGPSPNTFPLLGKIAEVIHYNRKLTEAEMNLVEGYLSIRYNISISQSTWNPSNPYQDDDHDPISQNINNSDSNIQFLYRPAFGLDFKHSQMFRSYVALKYRSPQENSNFYRATAGGKYGMFTSDAPGARTGTPSSPPYAPVYTVDPATSTTVPVSQGPNIPGVDVTGYDKSDITSPVARMVMSENTLEHFRADASRRSIDDDEGDYSVQPRHSQTLHPKGSKGDASYNTGDHSGE